MASSIDKELMKILKGEKEQTEKIVSAQPDEEDHPEVNEEDLLDEPPQLAPVVYEEKKSEVAITAPDLLEDYKFTRSNLYGLVGRTNAALDLALKVAAGTEHPRALEVVATLIKTSSDVSKELLEIHREIEKKQKGGATPDSGETKQNGSYTQVNNYYNTPNEMKDVNGMLDDLKDD